MQIVAAAGVALILGTIANVVLRVKFPQREPMIRFNRFRAWWMIVCGMVIAVVLGLNPTWGPPPQLLGFASLSAMATYQFFKHLKVKPTRHTQAACYISILAQYYWIYIHWYGFFVVFIPVFLFLYLPISSGAGSTTETENDSPLLETASLHWVMMTAVFCLSHAAYLLILPGGKPLLFFVILLTEIADTVRIVLSRTSWGGKYSPVLSCLAAIAVAWFTGPALTPLSQEHILLAGLVLGVAGSVGNANVCKLSKELGIERGGLLERMESMAYTAPIFLHGYRYFDYPFIQ